MSIEPDQYVNLIGKMDQLQRVVDQIDADLSSDREELSEFRLRISALEGQIDELRKQFDELKRVIKTLPVKTSESVGNAMEPTNRAMENLQGIIVDKEVVAIDTSKSKTRPWWKFYRR